MINTPNIHSVSSRLLLLPFEQPHLTASYVSWLNNPGVVKYSENRHRTHTPESCQAYFQAMQSGGHCFWAIEWAERERMHIGNLTAYLDHNNGTAEMAIMIGEEKALSKGLGLEAWQTAMDWLLSTGGVRKVHAGTMSVNTAMVRIFERSGMDIECRRTAHYVLDGTPVDLIYAGKHSTTS